MTIQVSTFFQQRWSVFWATTYTFERRIFDDYWFPRLGNAPLNATILADASRLSALWERTTPEEYWQIKRTNHHYLIRGVPLPGRAFHPKTYFFANAKEGVLLVGSGNLGLQGLEEGCELFSEFHSTDEKGLAAIRDWGIWMDAMVRWINDPQVAKRWFALQETVRWLAGNGGTSAFISNQEQPLLDQFVSGLSGTVEELHVLAPFFDQHATALAEIIARIQPQALTLYLHKNINVNGKSLLKVIRGIKTNVALVEYDHGSFVHAKLLGAIQGERGRLLSGSANLSRAALLHAFPDGNIEAGVMVEMSADLLRSVFLPDGWGIRRLSVQAVEAIQFQKIEKSPTWPISLFSATRRNDGHVVIRVAEGALETGVMLTNGIIMVPMLGDTTQESLAQEVTPMLVWLTNGQYPLSNKVPLDDPKGLDRWITTSTTGSGWPREIEVGDRATPVGAMLARLHHACIFDVDEIVSSFRAASAQDNESDPDFWERLLHAELKVDKRIGEYQTTRLGGRDIESDELQLQLRDMLNRVQQPGPHRQSPTGVSPGSVEGTSSKVPWTPDQRQQVRLYNVLSRWSSALTDPRLRWIDPYAPVRNFVALVHALLECWIERFLSETRLIQLSFVLFRSFIGTERTPGYVMSLSDEMKVGLATRLTAPATIGAAALCYGALRPVAPWRTYLFEWQPFLKVGLAIDLISGDARAADLAQAMTGVYVAPEEISGRLRWAAEYIDDRQWGITVAQELHLAKVELTSEKFNPVFDIILNVAGYDQPLKDVRLVTVVRQAFDYRKGKGIVLVLKEGRLSVELGKFGYALLSNVNYVTTQPLTLNQIRLLEERGLGWGALMVKNMPDD